ncbi:MAG: hypothetical protein HY841_03455 [Bacteroidetes bacterium]|nr:hypothetical protein [Bacteroidota bacterium]
MLQERLIEKRNIAFVHYPHYPEHARVDTMPFVSNTIKKLADAGWKIDLYLWENPSIDYSIMFPKNVHLHYQNDKWIPIVDSVLVRISKKKYKENTYRYRFCSGKKYDCVFGLGQIGAFVARLISKRNNTPLILFNDEFPSALPESNWKIHEKKSAQTARLIVVPDESRIKFLLDDYGLNNHPWAVLPNVSQLKLPDKKIDWHEKLNIPKHLALCLHAGSIGDFAMISELMTSVISWPENTALVLNDRNKSNLERMKKIYEPLNRQDRIFWNADSLSDEMLNSLVSYCKLNFGLYRNTSPNIEYIGFSSGKIMRSIAAGVPVIASDLVSLQFIKEHKLGVLVQNPIEIPDAISTILHGNENYKQNCKVFYENVCSFDKYWISFCKKVHSATGVMID